MDDCTKNLQKIYICGLKSSGKEVLLFLLDGHSKICMQPTQGFVSDVFICDKLIKDLGQSKWAYIKEYANKIPSFTLAYNGSKYTIDYSSFVKALYNSPYIKLWEFSLAKKLQARTHVDKEAKGILVDFVFDIKRFEEDWFRELFVKKAVLKLNELAELIYSLFIKHWNNKVIPQERVEYIAMCEKTGVAPIQWHLKHNNNMKIIILKRDNIGLAYTNAKRAPTKKSGTNNKIFLETLRRNLLLYTQPFIQHCKSFDKFIYSDIVGNNPDILVVEFEKLILDTTNTMKSVCKFLEIEYEDILSTATINASSLERGGHRFIGTINDDPYTSLSKAQLDLLNYTFYGKNQNKTYLENTSLASKALLWRSIKRAVVWRNKIKTIGEILKK